MFSSAESRAAAGICPACRADSRTTANPRYTRRPRKRTDIEVVRRRHRLQQKLNRDSKSARTSLGRGAPSGSWRGAACPRRHNPINASRPPVPHRLAAVIGKMRGLAAGRGTLESSLGVVTRDSPGGFICSSSPRGITSSTSPCLTILAVSAITGGDRTHPDGWHAARRGHQPVVGDHLPASAGPTDGLERLPDGSVR